jgi:hypothetical protein
MGAEGGDRGALALTLIGSISIFLRPILTALADFQILAAAGVATRKSREWMTASNKRMVEWATSRSSPELDAADIGCRSAFTNWMHFRPPVTSKLFYFE